MSHATMRTFTGRDVNPLALVPGDVCIEDIAHALAQIARFGGHARIHYSVARHSLLLAHALFDATGDSELARYALLHDAVEAYLGDSITPIKHSHVLGHVVAGIESAARLVICQALFVAPEYHHNSTLRAYHRSLFVRECAELFMPPLWPAPSEDDVLTDLWTRHMHFSSVAFSAPHGIDAIEQTFLAYWHALTPTIRPTTNAVGQTQDK